MSHFLVILVAVTNSIKSNKIIFYYFSQFDLCSLGTVNKTPNFQLKFVFIPMLINVVLNLLLVIYCHCLIYETNVKLLSLKV